MLHAQDTSLRIAAAAAPLRAQVSERVREAIADGRFAPGDRLIERELCEMLGVSRTSLREALRELESDGLVSNLPNKGMIVATISLRGAREIYEIREMFESLLAQRCAERATPALIARLEETVDLLAKAYASKEGLLKAKNLFYETLMEGADHQLASNMLRTIQVRAGQLRRTTLADPGRSASSLAEIRKVVAAIKKHDAKAAHDAAARHVHNAATLAMRILEERNNARHAA